MTVKKKKSKTKPSVPTKKKAQPKRNKKKNINRKLDIIKSKIKSNILIIIIFCTATLLIISTYAWFSASLNVKVKFFDLVVSSDNGLFISLDGIDYSDSVEISLNSVINELKATYPNHTNRWAIGGLWPVSSNGIKNANQDKFSTYIGEVNKYKTKDKSKNGKKFLNATLSIEDEPTPFSSYIAFDIFLKNVSGSPKPDNLYLDEGTYIDYADDIDEEVKDTMNGIMNSMRFGFVKISSVPHNTDVRTVQNLKCNNQCEMFIYEPNEKSHSEESIKNAKELGITIVDGEYTPTYGIINEGRFLEHTNGHEGTGIPLDTEHFALQKTIKYSDFDWPVFSIPNGVTKLRAYVWIEGQDIDSLETYSKGAAIYLSINFVKDLAGYE